MCSSDLVLTPPLCLCGVTSDGKMVLGGSFQMADTMGVPLWLSFDQARERGFVISLPHYFASAMEHGWDDVQTFGRMREALVDSGQPFDMEAIKQRCIAMFMEVARSMPGGSAAEVGRAMRENLEGDKLAHWIATHGNINHDSNTQAPDMPQ